MPCITSQTSTPTLTFDASTFSRAPALRSWHLLVAGIVAFGFVTALVFCCWREPLAFDAWGHYLHRQHVQATWSEAWRQAIDGYFHGNPRLGQVITTVLYLDVVHRALTPLVIMFVVLACCYLAVGRWPRLLSGRDFGVVALVTALLLLLVGNVGPMMFYRPYAGNYVYGFALYLALLLPYRRALDETTPRFRGWRAVACALCAFTLGLAAGLSNEHTGAAMVGAPLLAWLLALRRASARARGMRAQLAPWMIAGLLGATLGYLALLLAPGQMVRYSGLGRAPLSSWPLERGWGNLALLGAGVAPLAPALLGAVLLRYAPRPGVPRQVVWLAITASLIICGTVLFSPKVGLRLQWAATVLQVIATTAWLAPVLLAPRCRRWTVLASALVIVGHAAAFTICYAQRGAEQEERLRRLRAAQPGEEVALPCYRPRSQHLIIADDVAWPATQQRWRDAFAARVRPQGAWCAAAATAR